jgi:hypothetical protein
MMTGCAPRWCGDSCPRRASAAFPDIGMAWQVLELGPTPALEKRLMRGVGYFRLMILDKTGRGATEVARNEG